MKQTILLIVGAARGRVAARELRKAGFNVIACEAKNGWERFCSVAPSLVLLAFDDAPPANASANASADVVADAELGANALQLLARMRRMARVPVVLFSRTGEVADAVRVIQYGAADFVLATGDKLSAQLVHVARRMLSRGVVAQDMRVLLGARLPGASPIIRKVRERIGALAALRGPVLFYGERGSGRTVAARALHDLRVPGTPFLECCAKEIRALPLPPRVGSVHLRNLEALAPALQRELREQLEATVAAQNAGEGAALAGASGWLAESDSSFLANAVERGFDARLLRMLARFPVRLPSLRERSEDIPRIARALLRPYAERTRRALRFSEAALIALRFEMWPGNIGELADVVEKLAAFSAAPVIEQSAVREVLLELRPSVAGLRARGRMEEREKLLNALGVAHGNVAKAARGMGCSRGTVYRMALRHGVALRTDS